MKRKILMAMDGSSSSFNALHYLSSLFAGQEHINVHLLCVIPSGTPTLGAEWLDERDKMTMVGKGTKIKLAAAKKFMKEALLKLERQGISPNQISSDVKLSVTGVTSDILLEAQKGLYDALLIGRRGIGKIEELFMGSSLSTAMVEKCENIPIWIVDGKVNSKKFLLPVDTSFNSLKAADHLGFILENNHNAEVSLLHLSCVIGGDTEADIASLRKMWGEEWCDQHLNHPDAIFHAPEQILLDRGIDQKRINRLNPAACLQPHANIIRHSSKNDCGTIVIGRRSKGKQGILKGVSNSILDMANRTAVWVIG
jgi:nucleotide-binding universal stress UspA family protein